MITVASDTADLHIQIAVSEGRAQSYRAWLGVLFLDRKEHKEAARNAVRRGAAPHYGRLHDIDDSIGCHWRMMHEERRKVAKLRIRLAARPALMTALRESAGMERMLERESDLHDDDMIEVMERRRQVAAE
jgi:hypothetical protein